MKKILFALSAIFLLNVSSFGQAPQGINYQGVARNNVGAAMGMTNITVTVTIAGGSTTHYAERHAVQTDTFGLYSLVIGNPAAVLQGTFLNIPWSAGNLSATIDIDPGSGSQTVGTFPLLSVPYSLYSQNSFNTSSIQGQPVSQAIPNAGDVLQYNAGIWSPATIGGGSVTSLTGGTGIDASPSTITTTGSFSLAPSGVTANTYGDATQYPVITVDAMGRITNATTQTISTGNTATTSGPGLMNSVSGNTVTISAVNDTAIWNAIKLHNVPINPTFPFTNDVLRFNGSDWAPSALPPALPTPTVGSLLYTDGTNTWTGTNPSTIFTDGTNIGMGINPPVNTLDIFGSNPNGMLRSTNAGTNGYAGFFSVLNGANDSAALVAYTQGKGPAIFGVSQGTGPGGAFAVNNAASSGSGVVASTNGSGKAVFGINQGTGYAGAFMINNSLNDSAAVAGITNGNGPAVIGMSVGTGPGGAFQVWNPANVKPAIDVMTVGSGYSGKFSGGAGLLTDSLKISSGFRLANGSQGINKVLTSDAAGNGFWATASGSGLPAPQIGSLLYTDGTNTWAATNPTQVSSDGNSITVVNTTTTGIAGTFSSTNAGVSNQPALYVTSNSSTGFAIKAENTSGAAIVASSAGPYAVTADLSAGGGNALVGRLVNGSSGNAILGVNDNTSTGVAGSFENQNGGNTSTVLYVSNSGTGWAGQINGGMGLQASKLQISGNNPQPGYVLSSINTAGDATWTAPAGGLPGGSFGQIMYHDGSNWLGTTTSALYFDGMNLGIGTATPGSPLTVTSNFGTTLANFTNQSTTGHAVQGSIPAGGNGSVFYATSQGNAPTIYANKSGSVGSAASISNSSASNTAPVLQVSNVATSTGYSAVFNGGKGVQIDNLQVQDTLNIPLNANSGFVLTSDAVGNALWMAPPSGVSTVNANAPLSISGPVNSPTVNITQAGLGTSGYLSAADWNTFNNKGTVTTVSTVTADIVGGPITSTGTLSLANANANPGTYGSASTIPTFTVDSKGRITNITQTAITTSGTLSGGTTNYIPKWLTPTSLSGTSLLYDATTGVGVNTTSPGTMLDVIATATNAVGAFKAAQGNTTNPAGTFTVTNATNNASALVVGTSGTGNGVTVTTGNGTGISATTSGASAKAAVFQNSNTSGTGDVLTATSSGTGKAATFTLTNATNSSAVITAGTSGSGPGITVNTVGGNGVNATTTGTTGSAGTFTLTNASNSLPALLVGTSGTGPAIMTNGALNVGNKFIVNATGNPVLVNGVTTNFPAVQGAAATLLQNDGAGNLSWAAASTAAWTPLGNAGTVDGTNFIGTTDNVPLNFRVNNQRAGRISAVSNSNTAFGYQAINNNTGTLNVAFGYTALMKNTTGLRNSAVGFEALQNNLGGASNTAMGFEAMYYNAGGNYNSAFGQDALISNTSGSYNTAVGYESLFTNITNNNNTAVGVYALANSNSPDNTGIGYFGLFDVSTGSNNTGVGNYAGINLFTGSNNTFLGANAGLTNSGTQHSGATAIGANARVDQDNALVLGSTGVSVGIGTSVPGAQLDITGSSSMGVTLRATNSSTVAASAAFISNTSTTNGASVLVALANGTGPAGDFKINNATSMAHAVTATTNGGGAAVEGNSTGSGHSALFGGGNGMKADGITLAVKVAVNGANALTGTDYFFIIPAGTGGSVNLPSPIGAAMVGKMYVLKNLGGAAYLLGGGSTYVSATGVSGQGSIPGSSVVRLISDGSAWQAW